LGGELHQFHGEGDARQLTLTFGGRTLGICDDGRWEVAYRVVDDQFIEIVGISRLRG
jgi:hypothetical protein